MCMHVHTCMQKKKSDNLSPLIKASILITSVPWFSPTMPTVSFFSFSLKNLLPSIFLFVCFVSQKNHHFISFSFDFIA